jgi:cellulose biosynthesis protein BcsQ
MGKSISFGNEDGGAGKTTVPSSLADILADRGNTILLVDITPKCSMTRLWLKDKEIPREKTLFEPVVNNADISDEMIHDTENENIKVLAGHPDLDQVTGDNYNLVLRDKLAPLKNRFDFIFIDCANNGTLVNVAFMATDELYIILKPSRDSVEGAKKAKTLWTNLTNRFGGGTFKEYILNMHGDNSVSYRVEEELSNNLEFSQNFNPEHIIPDNATVNRMQYTFRNVGKMGGYTRAGKALSKIADDNF